MKQKRRQNRILILCTGNSCRSQMADGLLQARIASGALQGWEVFSAGVQTDGINPNAQQVMGELGIDISGYSSNHVEEFKELEFDLMLTLCDHAKAVCPWFPAEAKMVHRAFDDPAGAKGETEAVLAVYRRVRDEIQSYLETFVNSEMAISPSV